MKVVEKNDKNKDVEGSGCTLTYENSCYSRSRAVFVHWSSLFVAFVGGTS